MRDDRINSKKWFLTWSRLDDDRPMTAEWSLAFFMRYMKKGLPDNKVIKAVLCHEDHADRGDDDGGVGVHIHLIFELEKRQKWASEMDFFDGLYGKHPNVQSCRKWQNSVHYLCAPQEKNGNDPDYASYGVDVDAVLKALKTKQSYGFHEAANAMWKEKKTLDEVHDMNPGFFVREKRKLEDYDKYLKQRVVRENSLEQFVGVKDVPRGVEDREEWQRVVDWINKNFLEPRRGKQPQLWIWGPRGVGKSRPWMDKEMMLKYKKKYEWVKKGDRQDSSLLDADFILIDELCGSIPINELKTLSQMYGMQVIWRYGGIHYYDKNVPLIVTSQHSPRVVYKNCDPEDIEALDPERFDVVNVTKPYTLEFKEAEDEESDEDHSEESLEERRKRRKK